MVRFCVHQPLAHSSLALFCRDLWKRNLVALSHPPLNFEQNENLLSTLPNVLYAGFDPTADSLHVGNLLIITNLMRSSLFGCKPIALIGGVTAQIGDPSGRSTDRKFFSLEIIMENSKSILKQLVEMLENAKHMYGSHLSLSIENNSEWYAKMSAIDFMKLTRDFRVAEMLRIGPIRSRMVPHQGLSFSEFSYSIFQSYDWHMLTKRHNCYFQLGGSDQLGNLESGHKYIFKQQNALSYGICLPLLTDKNGQKLGKSTLLTGGANSKQSDAVWLDERKTSPYALYQYFRQMPDKLAEQLIFYFSFRPISQLEEIVAEHRATPGKWLVQSNLADEMVELVHSAEGLKFAKNCSRIMFSGSFDELKKLNSNAISSLFGGASTFEIEKSSIQTFGNLADRTRTDPQKRGSAAMKEGAFYVNGKKFKDPNEVLRLNDVLFCYNFSLISWGKRNHLLVRWV